MSSWRLLEPVDNRPVPSIALVTCVDLPEPDPDAELLLDACLRAGIEAEYVPWDDPAIVWSRYACAVLHSTWNYYQDPERFRDWARNVSSATRLLNPRELIEWNIDKRYLKAIQDRGIPIVPTRIVGRAQELEETVEPEGWTKFVVKPLISASSYMTKAFSAEEIDEATEFAEGFKGRPFMVQTFMHSVGDGGEVALVHIDGELTHGVIKRPRFHEGEESVSGAVAPTPEQAAAAKRVIAEITYPWLYARVDLMADDDGRWLLSELELIEPSLFFLQHPPALERFVSALKAIANSYQDRPRSGHRK